MPIKIIKVELGPKRVIFTNINWVGETSRTRFSGFCWTRPSYNNHPHENNTLIMNFPKKMKTILKFELVDVTINFKDHIGLHVTYLEGNQRVPPLCKLAFKTNFTTKEREKTCNMIKSLPTHPNKFQMVVWQNKVFMQSSWKHCMPSNVGDNQIYW